jgi:hypothetical protein
VFRPISEKPTQAGSLCSIGLPDCRATSRSYPDSIAVQHSNTPSLHHSGVASILRRRSGCWTAEKSGENLAQLGFTETNLTDAGLDIDSAGVMSQIQFTNQVRVART